MNVFQRTLIGLAVLLVAAGPHRLQAQDDEPRFADLVRTFKKPYLNVGVLVQAVGDFQIDRVSPGNNGFTLGATRLRVAGQLDGGFGYVLQTEFTGSPAVLDAQVSYRFHDGFTVAAGKFKVPFSAELLTSAASVDFVNRATVVSALSPARQVGVQVQAGRPAAWNITAGAFNGTRTLSNDNNHLLYAARVAYGVPEQVTGPRPEGLALGLSAAVSEDTGLPIPGVAPAFTGTRLLVGADVRWAREALLLAGEVIYGNLDVGLTTIEPWGFHATAGWMIAPRAQLLGRYERFERDPFVTNGLVAGLNIWPTSATEFQVNYLIDPDDADPDRHRVLLNFQVSF